MRLAGRGLGEDRGDAVEPLEQLTALPLADLGVGLDPLALLAHEQGDRLIPRADRRSATALHGSLDLADAAREHGQDALVVDLASTLSTGGTGPTGTTLTSIGHGLLLGGCGARGSRSASDSNGRHGATCGHRSRAAGADVRHWVDRGREPAAIIQMSAVTGAEPPTGRAPGRVYDMAGSRTIQRRTWVPAPTLCGCSAAPARSDREREHGCAHGTSSPSLAAPRCSC